MTDLMTLNETAQFLRVSRRKLDSMRKQKGFPKEVRYSPRKIFYLAPEVAKWQSKQRA